MVEAVPRIVLSILASAPDAGQYAALLPTRKAHYE
jgi:hypothetical protein